MSPDKSKKPEKGITVKKSDDFSEWYTQLLNKAELADIRYGVKGFVVYRSWAVISIKKMYDKYEKLLEKKGHLPLIMPTVIPENYFYKEKEHVEGFAPEVFWVTEAGGEGKKLEERLALRPTSETALYSMYSLWIRSYQDLPFKRYQSCQVFRYEGTATRPFFRAREFHWIEAHDVFATLEDAKNQVMEDMETTYQMLQDEFSIPVIFFQRPEWDKFAGAIHTYAADALMESGKVIQLPSTHLLGQNFSKPFNVKFEDKDGESKYGYITCYGPAISRIYGAMIALLSDNQGLILPFDLAPIQIVIVPIVFKGKEVIVHEKCKEVEALLKEKLDYSIKYDDRDFITSGEKFNEWEMRGVPIRVEIGPRDIEKDQVMVGLRTQKDEKTGKSKKQAVKISDLPAKLEELASNYTPDLKKKHLRDFNDLIEKCETIEDGEKAIEAGKIACIGLCSIDIFGYDCAEAVEKGMNGLVRGKKVGEDENRFERCIVCNKPNPETVYVARSY
ncbi:MAG: proline--tRNA ligase [Candidatus Hodarchaeota archaeon]